LSAERTGLEKINMSVTQDKRIWQKYPVRGTDGVNLPERNCLFQAENYDVKLLPS
jgi:hypothetical protein